MGTGGTLFRMPRQTSETDRAARPVGMPNEETTFRYRYTWAFCAWTVVVESLVAIVVIGVIRQGSPADAALVGLILGGFLSAIGWLLIVSQADVVVSETSVSRRLWGRTLREISWANVKKIRVWKMFHQGYRRTVRVFWVIPVHPSRLRFTPSGKISITEPSNMSGVIEHMNRHIAAHRIPVEVQVGTSWSDPASWNTRNRIEPMG